MLKKSMAEKYFDQNIGSKVLTEIFSKKLEKILKKLENFFEETLAFSFCLLEKFLKFSSRPLEVFLKFFGRISVIECLDRTSDFSASLFTYTHMHTHTLFSVGRGGRVSGGWGQALPVPNPPTTNRDSILFFLSDRSLLPLPLVNIVGLSAESSHETIPFYPPSPLSHLPPNRLFWLFFFSLPPPWEKEEGGWISNGNKPIGSKGPKRWSRERERMLVNAQVKNNGGGRGGTQFIDMGLFVSWAQERGHTPHHSRPERCKVELSRTHGSSITIVSWGEWWTTHTLIDTCTQFNPKSRRHIEPLTSPLLFSLLARKSLDICNWIDPLVFAVWMCVKGWAELSERWFSFNPPSHHHQPTNAQGDPHLAKGESSQSRDTHAFIWGDVVVFSFFFGSPCHWNDFVRRRRAFYCWVCVAP